MKKGFGTARRHIGWSLLLSVPIAALIVGVLQVDAWVARHSGEISAWFIARFGWADITLLFRAYSYVSAWVRWLLLPVAGIAAMAAVLHQGRKGVVTSRWLAAAWHWRTLLVATLAFVRVRRASLAPGALEAGRPSADVGRAGGRGAETRIRRRRHGNWRGGVIVLVTARAVRDARGRG